MEAGSVSPPVSEWEWPPTPRDPAQDFASLSEVAAALPATSPSGLETVAMEVDDGSPQLLADDKTPPANPSSPDRSEHSSDTLPSAATKDEEMENNRASSCSAKGPSKQEGLEEAIQERLDVSMAKPEVVDPTPLPSQPPSPGATASASESTAVDRANAGAAQAAVVDSPTSPAEAAPAGEPTVVGTQLVVLRIAMPANSTVGALLAKARERASAPGLEFASLHSTPDVTFPHVATLGAVMPPGVLRLLLRDSPGPTAVASTAAEVGATPCLFSPDQCWCYCCEIGTANP
ncbi:unnamed protein product, partial [Symbiodinium necroappetens]